MDERSSVVDYSMITMTTRSSRFFVVVLHLVGVSTHLPTTSPSGRSGIVGVNPLSIVLETLDPSSLDLDSDESNLRIQPHQPHWLQDLMGDQTCLDPMGGFSECGDATLWLVVPKKSSRRQALWRKWITWATEEEETEENTSSSRIQGFALQLYDDTHQQQPLPPQEEPHNKDDLSSSLSSYSFHYSYYHTRSAYVDLSEKECLTRRRKDNQLILVPCSQDRAWAWHFNEHGILHFKKPKSSSSIKKREDSVDLKQDKHQRIQGLKKGGKKTLECLARNASHAAILTPCDGRQTHLDSGTEARVLQIGLVRQATADSTVDIQRHVSDTLIVEASEQRQKQQQQQQQPRLPPSRIDIAHSHASKSPERVELKRSNRMTSLSINANTNTKSSPSLDSTTSLPLPLMYFKDTNPILLANGHTTGLSKKDNEKGRKSLMANKKSTMALPDSTASSATSAARPKPMVRKIQTNHYINEAKDERWTDPLTGLIYHTDLCRYLGHDRKEVGRHTLTGVGQYMKTVFNIKVRFWIEMIHHGH